MNKVIPESVYLEESSRVLKQRKNHFVSLCGISSVRKLPYKYLDNIPQVEYNQDIPFVEYNSFQRGGIVVLKHGILGLLSYTDMSGYEIREVFRDSLNFFWPVQTSQIYRELNVLEKNNWIVKQTVEQSGKPDKNICSITQKGREELLRWLSDVNVDLDMRSSVLMKTFFMGELEVSKSVKFFKLLNQNYALGLKAIQQTDASIELYGEKMSDKKRALFWKMTADFGKRYAQMYLDWTEHCIALLEEKEEQ